METHVIHWTRVTFLQNFKRFKTVSRDETTENWGGGGGGDTATCCYMCRYGSPDAVSQSLFPNPIISTSDRNCKRIVTHNTITVIHNYSIFLTLEKAQIILITSIKSTHQAVPKNLPEGW